MPDHDTPEGRLEAFCQMVEQNDPHLSPPTYATDDGTPFCIDVRNVLTRLKQAESVVRGV